MCSNLLIYVTTFQLEKVHLKFFPSKFIYDIDFKKTTKESIALGNPWICLLPQQCWVGQTQDLSPFSSLWSSSNPLFSCSPQDHLHATPCFQQQLIPGFVVGFLSAVNHELPDPPELFRKGQSCNHPPGQPASVGFLYISLSLGFHSNCKSVAARGTGKTQWCHTSLEDSKLGLWLSLLLGHAEAASRWVGSQPWCQGRDLEPRGNPESGPAVNLQALGSAHRDAHLTSWRNVSWLTRWSSSRRTTTWQTPQASLRQGWVRPLWNAHP